jgi:hypothetical protein
MNDPNRGHVNKKYNQNLPVSQTSNGLELDPEMEDTLDRPSPRQAPTRMDDDAEPENGMENAGLEDY